MQRSLRYPGFWLAVGLVFGVMMLQGVVGGIAEAARLIFGSRGGSSAQILANPLVLGTINILALGAMIALGLLINKLHPRNAFPLGTVRPGAWLAVLLVTLGGLILLSEADNVFRWLCPPPEFLAKLMGELFLPKGHFWSSLFTIAIVAPLTEEFLFRGIILRGLLSRYRPVAAVLLTAMLFAFMHLNPWQTISAFTLGTLYGWFYLRTGSVWPGVLGHAVNNGIFVIVTAAPFGLWEAPTADGFTKVEFQPWWFNVTGVSLLGLGLWLFRKSTPAPLANLLPPPVLQSAAPPPLLNP